MRYKKIGNNTARLASTSGHVVIVGPEFVEVPIHLEPEAHAQGCLSEEMYDAVRGEVPGRGGLGLNVEDAIRNMVSIPEPNDFTNQGLPNLTRLKSLCNRQVTKEEMMVAWDVISAEKDAEEKQ